MCGPIKKYETNKIANFVFILLFYEIYNTFSLKKIVIGPGQILKIENLLLLWPDMTYTYQTNDLEQCSN